MMMLESGLFFGPPCICTTFYCNCHNAYGCGAEAWMQLTRKQPSSMFA